MGLKKRFLGLLLVTAFAAQAAGADILISPASRVPNRKDHGVCWWASAETAGNHLNIPALKGLAAEVVKDGRGWLTGARPEDITHWMLTRGVVIDRNPHGWSAAGAKWASDKLAAGLPVISTHRVPGGAHAVLIWKFDYDTKRVHYYDSNTGDRDVPWDEWHKTWDGGLWAFDPKAQPGVKHTTIYPPKAATEAAAVPQPKTPPSNQDINDGVRRPDDRLRYGLYGVGGQGYDYYSEYRSKGGKP